MTPDEMSERLAAWARVLWGDGRWVRRVICVEPEGPRRTWVLTEGGRQVGHVRLRAQGEYAFEAHDLPWTWEVSDRTREMLGLDDVPGLAQTVPEEGSQ